MKFVIIKSEKWTDGNLFEAAEPYIEFDWEYRRADDDLVCVNGRGFPTEKEARSDIAKAKTAMKAARFAKVEVSSE